MARRKSVSRTRRRLILDVTAYSVKTNNVVNKFDHVLTHNAQVQFFDNAKFPFMHMHLLDEPDGARLVIEIKMDEPRFDTNQLPKAEVGHIPVELLRHE